MDIKDKETKTINFIEEFGCAKIKHLEILFEIDKTTLKNILRNHFINRKDDVIVIRNKRIDKKIIAALDVLCEYKGRYKTFYKNIEPVFISFLTKKDEMYDIIVSEKNDEEGIIKLLKNTPNWKADKLIILFEDTNMFDKIDCNKPYLYCTYPDIKII